MLAVAFFVPSLLPLLARDLILACSCTSSERNESDCPRFSSAIRWRSPQWPYRHLQRLSGTFLEVQCFQEPNRPWRNILRVYSCSQCCTFSTQSLVLVNKQFEFLDPSSLKFEHCIICTPKRVQYTIWLGSCSFHSNLVSHFSIVHRHKVEFWYADICGL